MAPPTPGPSKAPITSKDQLPTIPEDKSPTVPQDKSSKDMKDEASTAPQDKPPTAVQDKLPTALKDQFPGQLDTQKQFPNKFDETNAVKLDDIDKSYRTASAEVPITIERPLFIPPNKSDLQYPECSLQDAGTARFNRAPCQEKPNGTVGEWSASHVHHSVLQQHVDYFDRSKIGIISPLDTFVSIRKWGWNILLALVLAAIIHLGVSYPTCPSLIPDMRFRIWTKRIHKSVHGSDSLSYDNEGRFRPQMFEEIFTKYDGGSKGGLTIRDLTRFHKGQRNAMDFWGWSVTAVEWIAVYLLLWPEDGVMKKEDVRCVFDGSIFQKKADEYADKKKGGKGKVQEKST